VLTLPAAALVGAVTYLVVNLFGDGAAGPVIVSAALLIALGVAMARRVGQGQTLTAEG
jgi:inorganic phosphate transporter, PiT family